MIGRALDSLVSLWNPLQAARRAHARGVYENISTRAYEGAKKNRTNASWRTYNQSADMEMFSDADMIRSRARDLVRNNAYAKGTLKAIVRNVIGCGIQPQCRVQTARGKQNDVFNTEVERLWWKWERVADITGRLSFCELQRLVLSEVIEAGECLVRFVESSDRSRPLPLALELIEADRIAADQYFPRGRTQDTNNEVRRGVEIDAAGRPVAYWLHSHNPSDIGGVWTRPVRYPAEQFLHLYIVERIGQSRGLSWFAPVVRWHRDLHSYMDNELTSQSVASCYSVAIKSVGGPADGQIAGPSDEENEDGNSNKFERIEPGLVARLFPDEDISIINPSRGQSETAAWINLMLRSMAVGIGLSYERLTRDYSQTTYSSNRASDLEDRREFRPLQDWIITHLCIPVWQKFMASAVVAGAKKFPSAEEFIANYDRWSEHQWQPPGWEWVDPQNEATASIDGMNNNLTTLRSELAKRGEADWRDVMRQRAEERAYKKELEAEFGLEAMTSDGQPKPKPVPDEAEQPDEEEAVSA